MFTLLLMIFLHIVDDFYLQGILANMKQKSWWSNQVTIPEMQVFYQNDYLVALVMHGFSWTFMIMLPFYYLASSPVFLSLFLFNTVFHAIVDHTKANKHEINLVTDQVTHIIQIISTYLILSNLL